VIAGLITGTAITFIWELTPALSSRLYELIPAFAGGLLATIVVSLFTRPPGDVDEMFESMVGG
jgi:sodium/proline symporter